MLDNNVVTRRSFQGMSKLFVNGKYKLLKFLRINTEPVTLPYNNTNPIIYDKDDIRNCYTDEYIMALASAKSINLVGMITSSSVSPYNQYVTSDDFEMFVSGRAGEVSIARKSGLRMLPDPVRGSKGHLQRPALGKIEDTQPIGSEGSRLIVTEALKATPEKPLVAVMCGPLTSVADAYLLDNTIADKVIIAFFGGSSNDMADYNGWADPWAAYIVLQRLRLVQFPYLNISGLGRFHFSPEVHKDKLAELPDTELRQWMIEKQHPNGQPGSCDADAPPAISLMRSDYVLKVKRVSFSHWIEKTIGQAHKAPAFKDDPNGKAIVVVRASKDVATKEWWRALKNPAVYHQNREEVKYDN